MPSVQPSRCIQRPSPGLPPMEIAPFFDAGIAWDKSNDPSFSCGSDEVAGFDCREIVSSYGIAARLNLLGFLIIVMAQGSTTLASDRDVILNVKSVENPWSETNLEDLLVLTLSRDKTLRVKNVGESSSWQPPFPEAAYDLDSLTNWGREIGGRYLLSVDLSSIRLERKKSMQLPLVFHKWETIGIAEGELRLIDLLRGRVLAAEPFKTELHGKRAFQATMDDDRSDPDLHMTPTEKDRFFEALERQTAEDIVELLNSHLRGY